MRNWKMPNLQEAGNDLVQSLKESKDYLKNFAKKGYEKTMETVNDIGDGYKTLTGTKYDYLTSSNSGYPITDERNDPNTLHHANIDGVSGCLAQARAVTNHIGQLYGLNMPLSMDHSGVFGNSKLGAPTKEEMKKYPHYRGDKKVSSVDSWDMPLVTKSDPNKWNVVYSLSDSVKKHGPRFIDDPLFRKSRINIHEKDANEKLKQLNDGNTLPVGTYMGMGKIKDAKHYTSAPELFEYMPVHSTAVVGYNSLGDHVVTNSGKNSVLGEGNKDYRKDVNLVAIPNAGKHYTYENFMATKESDKKDNPFSKELDGKEIKKFSDTLHAQKTILSRKLGLSPDEYDELHKIALGIASAETNMGKDIKAAAILDVIGDSNGLTQLNPKNLKGLTPSQKNALKSLGLDPEKLTSFDLQSPEASAVATMVYLTQLDKSTKRWEKEGANGKDIFWDLKNTKTTRRPFRSHKKEFIKTRNGNYTFYHRDSGYDLPKVNDGETTDAYLQRIQNNKDYKQLNKLGFTVDINNGQPRIKYTSKGNNPNLTKAQRIAYGWNNPSMLRSGDATTPDQNNYVKKIQSIMDRLSQISIE